MQSVRILALCSLLFALGALPLIARTEAADSSLITNHSSLSSRYSWVGNDYIYSKILASHGAHTLGPLVPVDNEGDYRSAASGNWNAIATWERFTAGVWVAAVATPTSTDGVITIRSPHVVTISATVTYDQVVVDSGGQVTVAATITTTMANGAGTDLTINGTWLHSGGTWTVTGTTWAVGAGGTYIHNTNSSAATPLGLATLDPASTLIYRGSSTLNAAVSFSGRTFGNLIFESTSGTWTPSTIAGSTATAINGDFTIGSNVSITGMTYTGVLTIAGNFTQNGTLTFDAGTQNFTFTGSGKTISGSGTISFETFNVNAPASITLNSAVTEGSTFTCTVASGATLTVGSGGSLTAAGTIANSGTFNVNGTLQLNSGALVSGTSPVYGASSLLQYNSGGTFSRGIEWNAASGAGFPNDVQLSNSTILDVGANGVATAAAVNRDVTVDAGSTLNMVLNQLTTALTVGRNLLNNGTISNSGQAGGDIACAGDFTNNNVWNSNGRRFTWTGSGAQAFSGVATTFGGFFINPGSTVTLNADVSVTNNWSNSGAFVANGRTVSFVGTASQNMGLGSVTTFAGLTINNSAGVILTQSGIVSGTLTLTSGNITTNANTLSIASGGSVTRLSGHVIGNLQKTFTATGLKTFEVGTANGYSPVDVNVTAGTFDADFTVAARTPKHPNIPGANALSRYWTLTGTGITANLTFNYLDPTDIPVTANENNFVIFKYDGSFTQPGGSVNAGANTATINGVTSFSDWTLADPLAFSAGALQFSAANYDDTEQHSASHTATITVQRTGGSAGAVAVHWATSADTATAGDDYVEASGDLNWADGDTADQTFKVTVNGDTTYEAHETVNLTLSAATGGATIAGTNPATLTIQNDDVAPDETDVSVSGGNLIITDSNGGTSNDTITISRVSGPDRIRVNDPNNALTCGAGMTTVDANTCEVPLGDVTGNIQVNTLGGNDTLTLDLSGGDFIPAGGFSFAGGDPTTGPGDKLIITGGSQGTVTYNYTNANDGNIVMSNFGTVSYTGLEPITNSGNSTDTIFNMPAGGNVATLSDLTGGNSRLSSTGTFETTDFANPSNSLTINGGADNDSINVGALASGFPNLTINGNEGTDSVNFNGNITFATNANLDVNLQNDDLAPGIDNVSVSGQLIASGTGTIDVRASEDIIVNSAGILRTQNGNLTIEANQQAMPTSSDNDGVDINGGTVQSIGTGNISIKGTGGSGDFDENVGVNIFGGGVVSSTGTGTITVQGTGGAFSGSASEGILNAGVIIQNTNSAIVSSSAAINVTGQGGTGAGTTASGLYGVYLLDNGKIQADGAGLVTINGTGGNITSGGSGAVDSAGVLLDTNGLIASTGTSPNAAAINITANAGNGGAGSSQGFRLDSPGSLTTVDGAVTINATAGSCGIFCFGFSIRGNVTATGTGAISLTGTGGTGGTSNLGGDFRGGGATSTVSGAVTVVGDSLNFDSGHLINAGTNTVTLRQNTNGVSINLGSAVDTTASTLELSDIELDRVTCGTLNIGNASSGAITVSADMTRSAATNMTLISDGDVVISGGQVNTGGGTLLLDPGVSPDAVKPTKSGTDVTASTLSFGSDLAIVINGTTVDTQYNQLNVVGDVNLTGVDLKLSGTHTPAAGQTFTIVNNGGSNPITGTFNGLAEGAIIPNFLGSGFAAQITYVGGTGNDVVLTVVAATVSVAVSPSDVLENGATNLDFTFTRSGLTTGNLTVNFTVGGSAVFGTDYTQTGAASFTATTGTVTFTGSATTATATVDPAGDPDYEFDETVVLTVAVGDYTAAASPNDTATGTITNDDDTIIVTKTADTYGTCVPGDCSLREAITLANGNTDANTITFAIPLNDPGRYYYADNSGAGVALANITAAITSDPDSLIATIDPHYAHSWWSIRPSSPLPPITSPVFIDGYSQRPCSSNVSPCSSPNTLANGNDAQISIELSGMKAEIGGDGLVVTAGTSGSDGSVISGLVINQFDATGIKLTTAGGAFGLGNEVIGNFISTDVSGTLAVANDVGVYIDNTNGNLIGGTTAAARNVISGNNDEGIEIYGAATAPAFNAQSNLVQGNFIGTDRTGLLDLGNGTSGVKIYDGSNNIIGVDATAGGNVISGNGGHGVEIASGSVMVIGASGSNSVQGNYIGTDIAATATIGNTNSGVAIYNSSQNIVGQTTAPFGNVITNNGGTGVLIQEVTGGQPAARNSVQGNSIYNNGALGIDLAVAASAPGFGDGVTPNDVGDTDNGPNTLQNFPIVRTAQTGTPNVIRGTLNSNASQTFTMDLYATPASIGCDASGNGEGKTYLGSTTATTGANGDALWSFNPTTLNAGDVITATATDAVGNTSEFSACFTARATAFGEIKFAQANTNDTETNAGTHNVNIVVQRVNGADRAVGVTYTISNGTATTGDNDYSVTLATGTLSWANGDASDRNIPITVHGDTKFELDETVNITLSSPTGGATIAGTNPATLTIQNDDTQPTISIGDLTINEGNSGTTAFNFTVSLSNASYQTITVDAQTADDSATTADSDYATVGSTPLTFTPNTTTQQFQVLVNGDTKFELDDRFFVNLTGPANATIADSQGAGTITNDDTQPTIAIDNITINEGNSSTTAFNFTVSLSNPSYQTITVNAQTADDSATTADSDYTGVGSTVVTFNPGETSQQFQVLVNGDTKHEVNEQFFVNLSGASNATISDSQGLGTITNDDAAPAFTINDVSLTEGTLPNLSAKNFTFTVTKNGTTQLNATVDFATAPGTTNPGTENPSPACTAGFDYQKQTGSFTFLPNEITKTITVLVCRENVFEANETFFVNLSNAGAASITDSQGLGTIVNDDAPGGTLAVNTTDDVNDTLCDATHCSLREAINAANVATSSVAIIFAIPASDPRHFYYADDGVTGQVSLVNIRTTTTSDDSTLVGLAVDPSDPDWPHSWWSILPTAALPAITQTVVLDGYTQTGASLNTLTGSTNAVLRIEVNGTSVGGTISGLTLSGGASTISGLAINRFTNHGVNLSSGVGQSITGNFIGTDVSGTLDLGNAADGVGCSSNSATIGGSASPELVNLISGNSGNGLAFGNSNSNVIQNNLIGTKADGSSALSNSVNGISLTGAGSLFNTVGGTGTGEANTIAWNGADGVSLSSTGNSNAIRGNSIHSNGTTILHLGIDLDVDGVTANDPLDPDSGPNKLQNFPIVRTALAGTPNRIRGTLNSEANQTFTIDLYANTACDTSGNGEGKKYLGSTTADTGANGDALWSLNPTVLNAGDFITATATNSAGNTSEFSACFQATRLNAGTVQFVNAPYTDSETNADHTVTITVSRTGGSNLAVDLAYATSDGTATIADNDYVAASGTLHWNNGETGNKTFTITVKGDTVFEGDETVNITLSNPTNGATISGTNPTTLTITNSDPQPTLSISDVTLAEGHAATTSFIFKVTKTNDGPVSVNYQTQDGTATIANNDYQTNSGTLTFGALEPTKTITVLVNGDTTPELDETFSVLLSSEVGATISDDTGVGTILNDDESASAGQLIISEFRLSGPGVTTGQEANDEFIELYNNTDQDMFVTTTDGSTGWAVATSAGVPIFSVPNGTKIPARGHYLGVNSSGYSLASYAAGDTTWTTGVADNTAIAVFRTNNAANFNTTTRLDAVGPNTETNTLYKEGVGYALLGTLNLEHTFFRQICVFQAGCPTPGRPRDTNDNAADFIFADTMGTLTTSGERLGAPGPENLGSPIKRDPAIDLVLLDASVGQASAPNRSRNSTSDPGNASLFGTMTIRRRVVNQTGVTVTRLRFRVIDMTTHPSGPLADLRLRSSSDEVINGIDDPNTCLATGTPATPACTVNITGLTLEQPPNQPAVNGGGLNSTVTVPLPSELAPGQSINVNFLLGIQKTGNFRFYLVIEALPKLVQE